MADEHNSAGDSDKSQATDKIVFEVDGEKHQLTAEEARALYQERATVTQQGQKFGSLLKIAEKYGLDPEDLGEQADGAFNRLASLVEQGILTETGDVKQAMVKQADISPSPVQARSSSDSDASEERFMKIVEKALGPLATRLGTIEEDQARMIRMDVEDRIIAKHDNLDAEDVSRLFARARADRGKTIWAHAEEMSKAKNTQKEILRAEVAQELGISLEEYDKRNKLKEQDSKGLIAGVLAGRKLSFKKGEGRITPGQAWQEARKQEDLVS